LAAESGGYDASENDFSYEEFVADEFGNKDDTTKRQKPWWWYTAWLMIIVFSLPIILEVLSMVRMLRM